MSDGSEFQVCGAATENVCRVNSVRVLAADSIGASEDRGGRTRTAGWIRSFRYVGVDDESTFRKPHKIIWTCGRPTGSHTYITCQHLRCLRSRIIVARQLKASAVYVRWAEVVRTRSHVYEL